MAMKLEYVKCAQYERDMRCPHNDACRCAVKNCHKCGWNPKVAEARMQKFMQARGGR